jgi:hypothetical protein
MGGTVVVGEEATGGVVAADGKADPVLIAYVLRS